ncbi:hypothetical protein BKA93DRAFT_731964 [Sparassis latifolia]|uniref:Uncharacterized protein n=1 Tax=Sparassis crispa TaxID=139825 RepID=A0A401GFC1_9APHY|nr:hypothetical protein SCP_0306070 [Sparassis crispa]GBE80887.1 hypothetical protein SCP_0306070 [Sparassis crispa]
MPSSKLHLKPTPAEEAEHEWRKAQKAARRAAKKRRPNEYSSDEDGRAKRRRADSSHSHTGTTHKQAHDEYGFDTEEEYGPPPPPSVSSSHRARKPDYDHIYAQMQEERFREKMWGALEDDERLDAVESRLNAYAHVPRRWRGGGMDRMDDDADINPQMMEDEDYAEWIRAGMWRKQHAADHAEQTRKEAEKAARRAYEEAIREETSRLEKAAEEDRMRRKRGRDRKREAEAREQYNAQWKKLLEAGEPLHQQIGFSDVPWPVMKTGDAMSVADLSLQAISTFLVPAEGRDQEVDAETVKRRKDRLRETMLRFHPDKFEGRIMVRVREADREKVREAVGVVVRIVSELMGGGK